MKKFAFAVIALLAVATASVTAQIVKGNMITERTKTTLYGGFSFSNQTLHDNIGTLETDFNRGGIAGLGIEIPIRNGFYIQPEINYANLGGKYWSNQTINNTTKEVYVNDRFNYVQFPLLFKYRALFSGWGLYAGPQLGILNNVKSSFIHNGEVYRDYSLKSLYKNHDVSGVLGVEYFTTNRYNDRAPQFGVSLRWQLGLTDIVDRSVKNPENGVRENGAIYLTAGIRF